MATDETTLSARIAAARQRLDAGAVQLRTAYETQPRTSLVLQGRCRMVDAELQGLWLALDLPPESALMAVGGYGRGELFPASDVDLLVILPEAANGSDCEQLASLQAALWDIGLQASFSVRSVDQCMEAAADDISIQTSLLEARFLAGAQSRAAELEQANMAHLDLRKFYKAKRFEQEQRYLRFHDTPFALEPNCKDSPGGLRDLQMLGWIARAAGFGRSWRHLARHRFVTASEAGELRRVERFLQHLRIRLHYLTGRAEDRLLFDHQEALARIFGIEATASRRASEMLMQRYYLNAKTVSQLSTILMQNYGAAIFPGRGVAISINPRFQMMRELLDVRHEDVFMRHPAALLECFLLQQQRPELKGMTARTLRALWASKKRINAEFRADPDHRQLFMQILQQRRGVGRALRKMNEYGILSRYLPAWRAIVGQMQHDLFHAYTVDQHILLVIRNLRRFQMGERAHEYPLLSRHMLAFDQPWLLYLAALFHDIAKGRGGDHSQLGMVDADEFCRRHELADEERELVVWLVGEHLTMSHFAQKEDCTDPAVLQRFVAIVGNERRLIALYLLTHADIRATSPKVWSSWKGKLLEDLFLAVQRLLRGATPKQVLGFDERIEDARRLLRYHGLQPGAEEQVWAELDELYFMRHSAEEIAWHGRALNAHGNAPAPLVKARADEGGQGIQVMVFTPDQNELFVRLTGFFACHGFTILDARVHTTRHGYALDSFMLQDADGEFGNEERLSLIEDELAASLRSPTPIRRPPQGLLSRQVKHFPISPEVSIRADEGGRHHVLSLTAADRPGLLFEVAQVLAAHDIQVHSARISTMGERVEDTFLLTGPALTQSAQLLRIESELLERLQL